MKKVKLATSHGDIVLALDDENAPATVANFLEYVDAHHYDNTIFHRVIGGFMIQGGGFEPGMRQKPTRAVRRSLIVAWARNGCASTSPTDSPAMRTRSARPVGKNRSTPRSRPRWALANKASPG